MKLFKKFLRLGNTYACVTGDHVGKILIFVEKNSDSYGFLTIPNMQNLWVPKEKFDFGLDDDIIDYIERVPKDVRTVAIAQFKKNAEEFRSPV